MHNPMEPRNGFFFLVQDKVSAELKRAGGRHCPACTRYTHLVAGGHPTNEFGGVKLTAGMGLFEGSSDLPTAAPERRDEQYSWSSPTVRRFYAQCTIDWQNMLYSDKILQR